MSVENAQEKSKLLHWNYFLALEADIERLARFVEFSEDNFSTYSVEIAHIFLASSSEVDVIAKLLCQRINPNSKRPDKIDQYRDVIRSSIPEMESTVISLPRYGLEFRPWEAWKQDETP